MTLEVFLTSKPAIAQMADEGLRRVFGERLFATAAVDGNNGVLRGVGVIA